MLSFSGHWPGLAPLKGDVSAIAGKVGLAAMLVEYRHGCPIQGLKCGILLELGATSQLTP
jgi:hypothetical protein